MDLGASAYSWLVCFVELNVSEVEQGHNGINDRTDLLLCEPDISHALQSYLHFFRVVYSWDGGHVALVNIIIHIKVQEVILLDERCRLEHLIEYMEIALVLQLEYYSGLFKQVLADLRKLNFAIAFEIDLYEFAES